MEDNSRGHIDGGTTSQLLEGDALFAEFDWISEAIEHGIPVSEATLDRVIRSGLVAVSQAIITSVDLYTAK